MSNINVNFRILNKDTLVDTTSTYALSICEVQFVPDLSNLPVTIDNVVWDFGDGTFSSNLTATHSYQYEGIYNVKFNVTDTNGIYYVNTYSTNITVYDFVDNKLIVENLTDILDTPTIVCQYYHNPAVLNEYYTEYFYPISLRSGKFVYKGSLGNYIGWSDEAALWYLATSVDGAYENQYYRGLDPFNTTTTPDQVSTWEAGPLGLTVSVTFTFNIAAFYDNNIYLQAGNITNIKINRYNSWQYDLPEYTITPYCSGTKDNLVNVSEYFTNAWSHLSPYSKFYRIINTQYVPTSSYTTSITKLYAYKDNTNTIVYCPSSTLGSIFVGTSGFVNTYFSTDIPIYGNGHACVYLFYSLDTNLFPTTYKDINVFPLTLSATRVDYTYPSILAYSLNGITNDDAFNIPSINWQNTPIPFVINIQNPSGNNIKYVPLLSANNINQSSSSIYYTISTVLVDSNGTQIPSVSFYTENEPTANSNYGGYFKGYFICPVSSLNCSLSSTVTALDRYGIDPNDPFTSYVPLNGSSSAFNIFPNNYNYFGKINEDFDASAYYKSLRLQESLLDKSKLFDDFLGTIVGDISSNNNSLGKVVYEKIANFVDNNSNIDRANIDSVISLCEQFAIPYENKNVNFPPNLNRLLDLLSINFSKLKGFSNLYTDNFNKMDKTYIRKGINLGPQLDIYTGTFPVSSKIVAYERYSDTYKAVQTAQIDGYGLSDTLALSTFSPSWGWGLVLPNNVSGPDVRYYYDFYLLDTTLNKNIFDNTINWSDMLTTNAYASTTYADWSKPNGIVEKLISNELMKGLNLLP